MRKGDGIGKQGEKWGRQRWEEFDNLDGNCIKYENAQTSDVPLSDGSGDQVQQLTMRRLIGDVVEQLQQPTVWKKSPSFVKFVKNLSKFENWTISQNIVCGCLLDVVGLVSAVHLEDTEDAGLQQNAVVHSDQLDLQCSRIRTNYEIREIWTWVEFSIGGGSTRVGVLALSCLYQQGWPLRVMDPSIMSSATRKKAWSYVCVCVYEDVRRER